MKTEKSIQFLSNNRKLIAGPCKKQFFLSFYLFYYIHTPVPPLSQANQSDGNSVAREVEFDHHLTTSSSQPVPCIVFYVPTFFYNHHKQRRKLCILHNFRRFIMLFSRTSQFSDSKGQRFESPRPHQKRSLYCITVTFFIFLGLVLVNPLLTLRGNIGHGTHEKTDRIAHGISFPHWFCTSGSTRAILSVLVFIGKITGFRILEGKYVTLNM